MVTALDLLTLAVMWMQKLQLRSSLSHLRKGKRYRIWTVPFRHPLPNFSRLAFGPAFLLSRVLGETAKVSRGKEADEEIAPIKAPGRGSHAVSNAISTSAVPMQHAILRLFRGRCR